ncbi:ankyrin repeat domain-containing protein [Streptomyces sp. PTD5-9]|uniref:ankyrin repeat domain-containing protein n=1 Tax=Streptomyces sp. PTD5-9 TaxID=3120150 RepID=UPI00300B5D41
MSLDATAAALDPELLASWRQVRRYAVPRSMIEESAGRRAVGDWRGACAAARFDIGFELPEAAARYGPEVAGALEDDLRHLVPDLVRWHLPRVLGGRSTLSAGLTVVLAGYGAADAPGAGASAPYLYLRTPVLTEGPQRLSLRFGTLRRTGSPAVFRAGVTDWRECRALWDARRTDELRARAGGADRLPFLRADGVPLAPDELPADDPGPGDPVARAEWVTLLYRRGRVSDALAAAGIELDPTVPATPRWYQAEPEKAVGELGLDVPRLAAEARRFAALYPTACLRIGKSWRTGVLLHLTGRGDGGGPLIRVVSEAPQDVVDLPDCLSRELPDLGLLRAGALTPDQLHPLVAGALFPGGRTAYGPPPPPRPEPVRVRCGGSWHEVAFRDGRLGMPHSDQERQRENALRAFGGAVTGCFAVEHSCVTGTGRLPRALRAQRRDFFLRAEHGDTAGVLELLDAGVDPRILDGGRRSLLHVLHLLDHEELLPRLLAAGLGLEALDHRGRTPLCAAVADRGSAELVTALIEAGARIDVTDQMELSLAQLIRMYRRTDLEFLRERVEKEHPGVGAEWWDEWQEEREEQREEQESEDEEE